MKTVEQIGFLGLCTAGTATLQAAGTASITASIRVFGELVFAFIYAQVTSRQPGISLVLLQFFSHEELMAVPKSLKTVRICIGIFWTTGAVWSRHR